MGKRCDKGKPCGATCIERQDTCLKDAGEPIQKSLRSARNAIQGTKSSPYSLSPSVMAMGPNTSSVTQGTIKGILNGLNQESDSNKIDGIAKEKDINWRSVLSSGVSYVGGGHYGAFVSMPTNKLLPEGSRQGLRGQVGVKAGKIGENEVAALRVAGANDMGPKLIGARVSSTGEKDRGGNTVYNGVIAMSKVPAISYKRVPDEWGNLGSKSDMYWRGMANLHRLGIAHNDMHGGNVMLDSLGKARFVDFGLAQLSVKAALAEALGSLNWENWQFSASQTQGYARVARANLRNVERILASRGLSPMDIEAIKESGIRNRDDYYQRGAWAKISDRDARELIEAFYKGI